MKKKEITYYVVIYWYGKSRYYQISNTIIIDDNDNISKEIIKHALDNIRINDGYKYNEQKGDNNLNEKNVVSISILRENIIDSNNELVTKNNILYSRLDVDTKKNYNEFLKDVNNIFNNKNIYTFNKIINKDIEVISTLLKEKGFFISIQNSEKYSDIIISLFENDLYKEININHKIH
jgi:hypothetical protein